VIKLKRAQIILLVKQERESIKALKSLGLVRVADFGNSKLDALKFRGPSLN